MLLLDGNPFKNNVGSLVSKLRRTKTKRMRVPSEWLGTLATPNKFWLDPNPRR